MSRTKWILTFIAVVIVAVLVWRFVGGAGKPRGRGAGGDSAVPVTVVPAAARNVPVYITGAGTVQALNTVNVQPQVAGQLLKLDFVEGKPVKKGEVIAQIDPRSLQAQLDQAIARRSQDLSQLETAKANLARSENPKYSQYVPEIDRITQKNTVQQYQAAVAADEASIQDTRVQLGFTRVTSPIEGVAGIRQVDPGNVVSTGTTIVTITQLHPINVIFTLAGKYLDEVRTAQARAPLTVSILDPGGKAIEDDGVLKVIDNRIDPDSGSFKLKAEFPNADTALYPGEYANVRLEISVDENALVVPTAAVQRGPNGEYVWLVTTTPPAAAAANPRGSEAAGGGDSGSTPASYVQMQPITTGGEAGDEGLIVTEGLEDGDLVVTAGQFRLKDGSKVKPLQPGEVPTPPTTSEIQAAQRSGSGRRR